MYIGLERLSGCYWCLFCSRKVVAHPLNNGDGSSMKHVFINMAKQATPRCIISDSDSGCLSKELWAMPTFQLPLHVDALGDHHALGIIVKICKDSAYHINN